MTVHISMISHSWGLLREVSKAQTRGPPCSSERRPPAMGRSMWPT